MMAGMKRFLFLPFLLVGVSVSLAGPRLHKNWHPVKNTGLRNPGHTMPGNGGGGSGAVIAVGGGSLSLGGGSSSGSVTILGGTLSLGAGSNGLIGVNSYNASSNTGVQFTMSNPVSNFTTLIISSDIIFSDMVNLNGGNPSGIVHVVIMNPNPGGIVTPISISGNSFFTLIGTLTSAVPFTVNGAAYPAGSYSLPLYQSTSLTGNEVPIDNL